jgi:hypothetical protein
VIARRQEARSLAIGRVGSIVSVAIRCHDHYAAIELYELLTKAADEGLINLCVVTSDEPSTFIER